MAAARQSAGQAAAWMAGWLAATLALTIAGRELGHDLPVFVIMLLRSLCAVVVLAPFMWASGGFTRRSDRLPLHGVRNIVHYAGQYAWFTALTMIPLAPFIAIEFTLPVWIAILATLVLGERMTLHRAGAVALGFLGILVILRPGAAVPETGHLIILAAALGFSVSMLLTKELTRTDSPLVVIFMMFAMQTVIGIVPALLVWRWPAPEHWIHVAIIALAGTGSHFCLTKAMSLADITVVAPMDFLRVPLTALAGFLVYAEAVDVWTILGTALILGANIANLRGTRR